MKEYHNIKNFQWKQGKPSFKLSNQTIGQTCQKSKEKQNISNAELQSKQQRKKPKGKKNKKKQIKQMDELAMVRTIQQQMKVHKQANNLNTKWYRTQSDVHNFLSVQIQHR